VNADTEEILGKHNGAWFYTAGQRRGVTLNYGPWYVVKKDHTTNQVFVSNQYKEKPRNQFFVSDIHWISEPPTNLKVKLRHGPNLYDCTLTAHGDGYEVEITGQDQGIAPGQFAVFYDEEFCYGCGVISEYPEGF